jgi:AAA domain
MLSERVRELLRTQRLVVAIGARGTGKSRCAEELTETWHGLGVQVLRIDAASAEKPQDLDRQLTAALGCESTELTARYMPEDGILRVIVDRAEHLYDRVWLGDLQERWRALLADEDSKGRLAIVFFGRPVFRQIAGGDSSPLLNAGPVITPRPLTAEEIERRHCVDSSCASAVRRKTGGHPQLTAALVEAIDRDAANLGDSMDGFVEANRRYLVSLIQDHPLEARAALSELLEKRAPLQ